MDKNTIIIHNVLILKDFNLEHLNAVTGLNCEKTVGSLVSEGKLTFDGDFYHLTPDMETRLAMLRSVEAACSW